MAVEFESYGRPLEMVVAFNYLGMIRTASDNNWMVVVENLQKSQKCWARLSQILWREGTYPWTSGTFYKDVVQATLLFGTETWVVSPRIGKTLGGFHHRVYHRLSVMSPRRGTTGMWVYPPLDAAMMEVFLEEVETYVLLRHNIVAHYIVTHLILELYLEAERRPRERVT